MYIHGWHCTATISAFLLVLTFWSAFAEDSQKPGVHQISRRADPA